MVGVLVIALADGPNEDGGSRGLISGRSKGSGVTLTGGEAVLTERRQIHDIAFMRNVG